MRNLNSFLTLLILSLFLASCAPKPVDMAALRKTIDEYNAASVTAMKTNGNMDKVMTYYADDAVQLPPNAPMNKGKEAIKKFMNDMMASGMKISEMTFTPTNVEASGNIAYEVGTYDMSANIPGVGDIKDSGKYVDTWKQQADGSWKVAAETWNTSMPMPAPEMKKDDAKKK